MKKDPAELLESYASGKCSEEERAMVESWYLKLGSASDNPSHEKIGSSKNAVWANLNNGISKGKKNNLRLWYAISVAAILVIVFITVFINNTNRVKIDQIAKLDNCREIKPGGNKAYLTLENGRKVALDELKNGEIANLNGVKVAKLVNGQLAYIASDESSANSGKTRFNTIETPAGGQYQVILPDGTKVWLNAASSLRYPTRFGSKSRVVELDGEGYFEVAKVNTASGNSRVPFIVKTRQQQVEVLGTHFNINSYRSEPSVKTTLLEGSVSVSQAGSVSSASRLLKPGEQSTVSSTTVNVSAVNAVNEIAWKNGDFIFDGENLHSIMRKISRWYDTDIVYQGAFDDLKFGGYISRSKDIADVLDIMESTGKVHFELSGRRITVVRL